MPPVLFLPLECRHVRAGANEKPRPSPHSNKNLFDAHTKAG